MSNDYQYVDYDYIYTDPATGVLRNLGNITDDNALTFAETGATTKRTRELIAKPISIKDSSSLLAIHKYLFQDIYAWAGQKRTVEISKGGRQFFPLERFDSAFAYIDTLLTEYKNIDNNDFAKISHKLAEILDTVNFLHPFREGNGRTQREFLRVLALAKGLSLNLNPPDNIDVYERYMQGTINGDIKKLADLIAELLEH